MEDITPCDLKLKRHQEFWSRANDRPLLGVIIGGWARHLENPAAKGLWGEGVLAPAQLAPELFVDDCRSVLQQYAQLGDDLFHAALPFPAVPWLEAIAGCRVRCSSHHLWAEPLPSVLEQPQTIHFDPLNSWAVKYVESLDVLDRALGPQYPVAQSVVRGPADVASALLGETRAVFALNDTPKRMRTLLSAIGALSEAFLRHQSRHVPPFRDGSVVGQYEVWAPGWALRLQDDAVSLLSPQLYREFLLPLHARLAALSPYSMFHMHTTSLHVLPDILSMPLGGIEISRDEGYGDVVRLVAAVQQTQAAGKPVVLKGRFALTDITRIVSDVPPRGFCLQAVVDSLPEAEEMFRHLRSAWNS